MVPSFSTKFLDDARLALAYAVEALADAEQSRCEDDEILKICEEVIRRRVRLQVIEIDAGRRPGPAVREVLRRDICLLREPSSVSLVFQAPHQVPSAASAVQLGATYRPKTASAGEA
jgi:hypothetical protein